jgi:hypothetical protein
MGRILATIGLVACVGCCRSHVAPSSPRLPVCVGGDASYEQALRDAKSAWQMGLFVKALAGVETALVCLPVDMQANVLGCMCACDLRDPARVVKYCHAIPTEDRGDVREYCSQADTSLP